jgi:GTP-binding protein HflX
VDDRTPAVLLQRVDPAKASAPYSMEELRSLAGAAGYRVLAEIVQRRPRDSRFQLGRGKILEALSYRPEKLIFYNPLSPKQVHSISQLGVPVIDRFHLILEIFASRASTREAKLQVELARLSYNAPHVRDALSQSKISEQPGFRGSGAYEQSIYRDMQRRIAKIRRALRSVELQGEERRVRRREMGFDLVALAGYTNAGKSTLLNALTDAHAAAEDQPFTTLSPTTRALEAKGRRVLLTDTVGFIDDLPHFLIKAFSSTLAEISRADLVLLVADASDPLEMLRRKLAASHKALWDCGVSAPIITVLNKMDRLSPEELAYKEAHIRDLASRPVFTSAELGMGLEMLVERIGERLQPMKEYQIRLPNTDEGQRELSSLYRREEIFSVSYGKDIVVRLRGREETASRLSGVASVLEVSGEHP